MTDAVPVDDEPTVPTPPVPADTPGPAAPMTPATTAPAATAPATAQSAVPGTAVSAVPAPVVSAVPGAPAGDPGDVPEAPPPGSGTGAGGDPQSRRSTSPWRRSARSARRRREWIGQGAGGATGRDRRRVGRPGGPAFGQGRARLSGARCPGVAGLPGAVIDVGTCWPGRQARCWCCTSRRPTARSRPTRTGPPTCSCLQRCPRSAEAARLALGGRRRPGAAGRCSAHGAQNPLGRAMLQWASGWPGWPGCGRRSGSSPRCSGRPRSSSAPGPTRRPPRHLAERAQALYREHQGGGPNRAAPDQPSVPAASGPPPGAA